MEPLKWLVDWSSLTPCQKVFIDMPFFGLRHRVFKDIMFQMQQRNCDCFEYWSQFSERELMIRKKLLTIISEELPWPNTNFHPSDPFGIVMWDGSGDLATAAAIDRIESEFALERKSDEEWKRLATQTFGDVIKKMALDITRKEMP